MNQSSEDYLVVNRPPAILFQLFAAIQDAEGDAAPDSSRPGIWDRAVRYIIDLGGAASDVLIQAAKDKPKLEEVPATLPVPGFLKIRIDPTLHRPLIEIFRQTYNTKKVKAAFLTRVVLSAYLLSLTSAPQLANSVNTVQQIDIRLELNRRFAQLLADTSPSAQKKLALISKIMEGKANDESAAGQ